MSRSTAAWLACFALLPFAHAADYQVDPSFGNAGWSRLFENGGGTQDEKAVAFARTVDGGYVVALEEPGGGANGGTGKRIGLNRLDRNGNYVTSGFGTGGRVFKDAFLTSVTDMTIDAQGRIIVVGATPGPGGLSDFGVVRFNSDGSDDSSFAGDGGTSFGFENGGPNIVDSPTSVLTDPDGRIVVAGSLDLGNSDRRFGIVRLNVDGSIDSTFGDINDGAGGHRGTDGTFVSSTAAYASRILRIVDGYYVITGTSVFSSTDTDFAARILTPSGGPWVNFIGSSTFPIDEPGPGGSLFDGANDAILVNPTTILLVGNASGKFAATRIKVGTSNGSSLYSTLTWDPSFIGSAIVGRPNRYVGNTPSASCQSAALRSDGRILLVGGTSSAAISRTPNGMSISSGDEPGGNFWTYAGLVTRLNPDGSPDSGFGLGGSYPFVAPTSGGSQSIYSEFKQVRFDGAQAVIIGSSVDNNGSVSDFDGVITRLQSDTIFANGFEAQP
ncbi:MAG: hypothetical protein ABIS07_11915 [Dokdonella sp.]